MKGVVVRPLNGSRPAGVLLLLAVQEHAEVDAVRGGAWLTDAAGGRLMDSAGAVWEVSAGLVRRIVFLSCRCSCTEVTTYRDGAEVARIVGPAR